MCQRVGQFLSEKSKEANYGDGYNDSLADCIQNQFSGIKGFNRRGLYRMKQFYETCADNEKVSPLVTQLSWTNHLLIVSGGKSDEEREFYMRLAVKERYSKRQLERQMDSGYYERHLSKNCASNQKSTGIFNSFMPIHALKSIEKCLMSLLAVR